MMLANKKKKKIILGSWSWSGQYKTVSNKEVEEIINLALKNNFFQFDTSPTYGKGEKILAEYRKKNKNILIDTKCGWNKKLKKTFEKDGLLEGIDFAIEKFDKINTIQLHNPRREIKKWDKIIYLLEEYKKKKLIKYSGISLARNHYFPMEVLNQFDFIQDEFNLLRVDSYYKMKKFKNCLAARSPFANGILTSNFKYSSTYSKKDHRFSWLRDERLKNIFKQKTILEGMTSDKIEKFAMDFIFSFKMFDKIIFGVRTKKQFHDLLKNLNNIKIVDKRVIKKVLETNKNNFFFKKSKNRYNN